MAGRPRRSCGEFVGRGAGTEWWHDAGHCRARRERSGAGAGTADRRRQLPDCSTVRGRSGVHRQTRRADVPCIPVRLDNLIHEKRIPPIVAVLLSPGPGGQRTIEYDTVSDRYVNFVETEVLPRITRDYQVAFTTDPEGRAAFGESSGAAAALTMAWLHPNLYHRVISYSGTFVALQR